MPMSLRATATLAPHTSAGEQSPVNRKTLPLEFPPFNGRLPRSLCSLAVTAGKKEMLARQIKSTDGAIDRLVYELSPSGMIYGLTEEEIRIVEGKE